MAALAILDRAEKRSPRRLTDDELLELPALYRTTLSSLAVARATSLDVALIDYLEALALRKSVPTLSESAFLQAEQILAGIDLNFERDIPRTLFASSSREFSLSLF